MKRLTKKTTTDPKKVPDDVPRAVGGDVLAWFEEMAVLFGYHPRMVAASPSVLKRSTVDPKKVTEELIREATRSCWPLAKKWAEEHNALVSKGKAAGWVSIKESDWFSYRLPLRPAPTPPAAADRLPLRPTPGPPKHIGGLARPANPTRNSYKLFGLAHTAIIRWLGANAVTKEQCRKVFTRYGWTVPDATLDAQYRDGLRGTGHHGPVPTLIPNQEEELYHAAEIKRPARSTAKSSTEPTTKDRSPRPAKKKPAGPASKKPSPPARRAAGKASRSGK